MFKCAESWLKRYKAYESDSLANHMWKMNTWLVDEAADKCLCVLVHVYEVEPGARLKVVETYFSSQILCIVVFFIYHFSIFGQVES